MITPLLLNPYPISSSDHLAPSDITFISFLYRYKIPFLVGFQELLQKDILHLFITGLTFHTFYIPWFSRLDKSWNQTTYSEPYCITVLKTIHTRQLFEIICLSNYVTGLIKYNKANGKNFPITPIFLIKDNTILNYDTMRSKNLLSELCHRQYPPTLKPIVSRY